MAFNVKYRCEFDTVFGRSVKVDIEEDGTFANIIQLEAFGQSPLYINYPNAEFDKLNGIRESKVRFSVLGGDGVTASDFLTTSDTQYKIKIYFEGVLEWVGWLDNDQLSEPFQDGLYEIKLSGTDGLSLLKNRQLADLSDAQIWGIDKVKNFITFALDKTDLGLNWWAFINMYPVLESGGTLFDVDQRGVDADFDMFYYANITSFTFLTGTRTFDDCYTVLSKIMEAFCCQLFQARGKWYIIQLNDRIAGDLDGSERNASGTDVGTALNQDYSFNVGLYSNHKLINADALVSWEKAFKEAKISYEFKLPPAFFKNFDLIDGTFNAPLSSASRGVFTLDGWTEVVSDTWVGVELDAVTNAEIARYILQFPVSPFNDTTIQPKVRTTKFGINKFDKISFSYATREKNSGFAATGQSVRVIIEVGTDKYYLDDDGKWYLNIVKNLGYNFTNSEDRRFWKEYSITSEQIPANGLIYLEFDAIANSRTTSNEVHYKDISFSVTSYFNERLTVKGYEHSETQTSSLKNNYENQLFLSESPNIGMQGAIMKDTYLNYAGFKYYSADKSTLVPFYRFINRVYWRGVYRNFQRLEASMFNLYDGRLISLLNTVTFDKVANKEFLLTTMDSDIRNEQSEIRFVELRDTSTTDDFDEVGTEFFRYISVTEEVFNKIPEEKKPIDWKLGPVGAIVQLLVRGARRRFNNYG